MTPRYQAQASVLVVLGCGILPAIPLAQTSDGGGLTAALTVSESLEATRNLALTPDGTDTTLQSVTTLGFAMQSETQTQVFAFDAGLGLRASATSGDTDFGLGDRSLSLSYGLEGVRSSLGLSAAASQADVEFFRPLSDFIDGDTIIQPSSFDDLTGTGTRTDLRFAASLSMMDDAPFGLLLDASYGSTLYQDTTDPDLVDSTQFALGLDARFDISPVTQIKTGLRYSEFSDDDGTESDSVTLTAGAVFTQPAGTLGFNLSATPGDDGTQLGFAVSRQIELPDGTLGGNVGVVLTPSDETILTGGLNYSVERAAGTLSASFDHSVATAAGATGDVTTALSLQGSTALSPDVTASLRAGYARYEEADVDGVTSVADLSASVSYALSPDWSLSAGASYLLRDPSDGDRASAQTLSLTVSRLFDVRN
ncbi:TonB-dependent receptor [Flavimaricola marinus]|uniref:Uncharacterized protein n=1 Tax=Flavimaricola marinus TaxID=1819565 RepID=A0A238LIR2_9RHOB|nr:TonB-dependent receptor [Flavimaricola marinus]SMY09285.1 hypothetical protein LOM8899_03450 [Flavimaricola marinus]